MLAGAAAPAAAPAGSADVAATDGDTSGWYGLLAISQEARQRITEPPQSCPHDGEPYTAGPDGKPFCVFDGYRPGPFDGER